jgi:hypothetical protein
MIRPTLGNVKNRRPFALDIGSLFNASFELGLDCHNCQLYPGCGNTNFTINFMILFNKFLIHNDLATWRPCLIFDMAI